MKKAFIFDMDGVLVDSERTWERVAPDFHESLFGKDIAQKIGNTIGMSVDNEYKLAVQFGFTMERDEFYENYNKKAAYIYDQAPLTKDLDKLMSRLLELEYSLAVVSSSPKDWIEHVFRRLPHADQIHCVLSLNKHPTLKAKPEPDGYREAMKQLHAGPETTMVLEDSNAGIQAAKAAGAFTIGFRENLVDGYEQQGADTYADTVHDVLTIVESHV